MSRRFPFVLAAVLLAAGCSSAPADSPAAAAWVAPAASESAAAGVAAPAAGGSTAAGVAAPAAGGSASAGVAAPAAVPAVFRFTGRTLDGKGYDASTLAGRPAILWFWAPWCATCASEAQSIADLADKYQGRIGILGIAGMGDNKAMHEFVSDLDVGAVPHLDDSAGRLWKHFKITEQSTYVLVDRTGKVARTGYLDDLQLTTEVQTLVS